MAKSLNIVFAGWISIILISIGMFAWYDNQAGKQTKPPLRITSATRNTAQYLSAKSPRLLVFLHPLCPCSMATVQELHKLVSLSRKNQWPLHVTVYFLDTPLWSKELETSRLWQNIQMIPDIQLMKDPDGKIAEKFHVETSGQVIFYDANSRLRFFGGITPSRGHEGSNLGSQTVVSVLTNQTKLHKNIFEGPTFGCSLFNR